MPSTRSACSSPCTATHGTRCCTLVDRLSTASRPAAPAAAIVPPPIGRGAVHPLIDCRLHGVKFMLSIKFMQGQHFQYIGALIVLPMYSQLQLHPSSRRVCQLQLQLHPCFQEGLSALAAASSMLPGGFAASASRRVCQLQLQLHPCFQEGLSASASRRVCQLQLPGGFVSFSCSFMHTSRRVRQSRVESRLKVPHVLLGVNFSWLCKLPMYSQVQLHPCFQEVPSVSPGWKAV
jgi:hypothetical protein